MPSWVFLPAWPPVIGSDASKPLPSDPASDGQTGCLITFSAESMYGFFCSFALCPTYADICDLRGLGCGT